MKLNAEKGQISINKDEILDIIKLYLEREGIRYNNNDISIDVDTVYDRDDTLGMHGRQELIGVNIKNIRITI